MKNYYDVDTKISNIEEAYLKSQVQVVNSQHEGLIERTPLTLYSRQTTGTNYFLNSIKNVFSGFNIPCIVTEFDPETLPLKTTIELVNNTVGGYVYCRTNETKDELDLISQFVKRQGDIDGMSYDVLDNHFAPSVVRATMTILAHFFEDLNLNGKTILLVNRSRYVGMPLHYILTSCGATVLQANSTTPQDIIADFTDIADIQIWATGVKGIADLYVEKGELVIDVSQVDTTQGSDITNVTNVCKVTGKLTCLSLVQNYLSALPKEPLTQQQN